MTTIELVVAGAIATIVSAGVYSLASRSWQNHDALVAQNDAQRQARAALDMASDAVRSLSPWSRTNVVAYQGGPSSSVFGAFGVPSFQIARRGSRLVRLIQGGTSASVANITRFDMQYEGRQLTGNGTVQWTLYSGLNNRPASRVYDPRLANVATVYITVTATAMGADGLPYSCTLSSAVNVRNQFFVVAPPAS